MFAHVFIRSERRRYRHTYVDAFPMHHRVHHKYLVISSSIIIILAHQHVHIALERERMI